MQLQLNFEGKKTERITFAAPEDLKKMLEEVATDLHREDISDLVREYVIEGVTRDKGKLLLMKARGESVFLSIR